VTGRVLLSKERLAWSLPKFYATARPISWQVMSHHDSGYRPDTVEMYDGFDVFDHGVWPTEINYGEVDGDVSFEE